VSDAPQTPATPAPRAAIHDLGYKRNVGTRRPQSTRWRVIVKTLVATSWRGWWRMKLWVIAAIMTTVGVGVPMYISRDEIFEELMRGGVAVQFSDAMVAISYQFYPWWGFLLGATIAAGAVARDLRAGAFEFYFSRPVRPVDYLAGKVGGVFIIMSLALAVGPLVLSLFRVGLSRDLDEVWPNLAVVPKVALVGVLSSLAYAVVPLAISTLAARPRITISIWVVFYFIFGGIMEGIAIGLRIPDLGAVSLPNAVRSFAWGVLDVHLPMAGPHEMPGVVASSCALIGYAALGLVVLHMRLRAAEQAGLGGG
jgi:ABC-type transport system involved in multi-copper enzyme maturation permease subunit